MKKEADEYCEKILMALMVHDEDIRFNDLHRRLAKYGAKMSKPTLNTHLRHLVENEMIQRNEEDKQNVSYGLNWKRFKQLKGAMKIDEVALVEIREEKTFKAKSLTQQTVFTTAALTIGELFYMKLMILNHLEPENTLQNNLSYSLIRRLFNRYAAWLFQSCKESKEDSQRVLHSIDTSIKTLEGILFDKKLEAKQQDPENKTGILKEF